jgi:uncharacterized protein (TIGR02611 family)
MSPEARESSAAGTEDQPSPPRAGAERKQTWAAKMADGLEERRDHHLRRSRPHRLVIMLAGFVVTLAGIVMTGPVPGPGVLFIAVGMALLALEFDWAERLLHRALEYLDQAGEATSKLSPSTKILVGVLIVIAIAAFVAAAIAWDIPVLPV